VRPKARCRVIVCVATLWLIVASVLRVEGANSEWVYPGPDGKLVYKTTLAGDRIVDFSYAGYMGGGVALPTVPVRRTVEPSGGPDDTAAIQAAIDAVSAMNPEGGFRGAVLLKPGTYTCSGTISISADGVVLRGSGSAGGTACTIKMVGGRHCAIVVRAAGGRSRGATEEQPSDAVQTSIAHAYVPCGATSFTVADAAGFAVGDTIAIRRPVTDAWVHFMQMDDLVREGRPQTWIRPGTSITTERRIAAISGNKISLDIPLADSFDSRYLNPPGTVVAKIGPAPLVSQIGVECLRIQSPPMEINYSQHPYTAMRINGQDCWARDIVIEETMNSVSVSGRRITLERVAINRTVPHVGSSKPAEFAPNAGQILLDRCSSNGDNLWHVATGGRQAGPIVLLNCTFRGTGHIEGHQRWTTGMLLDNCKVPEGGIDFKNRGSMGSGHGWGTGWSVAWNCTAKNYVVQQPPGACNWIIGCTGENIPTARPFDKEPTLPLGVSDSPGRPVTPQSLYLAQLAERLGPQALKNIGYSPDDAGSPTNPSTVTDAAAASAAPDARLDYTPGKAPEFWSIATAETIMARWPDYNRAYHASWTYVHGYTLCGFEMLYRATGDKRYFDFIQRYIDKHIDKNGDFRVVMDGRGRERATGFGNQDNMMTGNTLVMLYEYTKDERYKKAATTIRRALDGYPRNSNGGLWHSRGMHGQWWIDGIFMSQMFLTRYGKSIGDTQYCWDEAARQIIAYAKTAEKGDTGMMVHGTYEPGHGDRQCRWADPNTGLSPEAWSEGLGWYALVTVETLADLPKDHARRAEMEAIFRRLAAGLKRTQDPKSGRWFQVVDKGDRPDNWTDTSGSAMFTYAIRKGIEIGLLDEALYAPVVVKGYKGIVESAKINGQGLVDIYSACDGLGVQASYDHYIRYKQSINAKEAVAGFLWATMIVERPDLEKLKR